jgi:hypothetical protein
MVPPTLSAEVKGAPGLPSARTGLRPLKDGAEAREKLAHT